MGAPFTVCSWRAFATKTMYVLAIDTSHEIGSATFDAPDGTVDLLKFGEERSHLTEMDAALTSCVEVQEKTLDDVDRIALVVGPGSFTGIRIAMAWAKGLYAARPRDVVTMNGLELLGLAGTKYHGRVAAMIDARKDEIYAALYETNDAAGDRPSVNCLIEPCAVAAAKFADGLDRVPTLFVGTGATRYRREITDVLGLDAIYEDKLDDEPSTALLAALARDLEPLDADAVLALEPLYIRPSDAKLRPLKKIGP